MATVTIRCPGCQGVAVLIDRFSKDSEICRLCQGKGRIVTMTEKSDDNDFETVNYETEGSN